MVQVSRYRKPPRPPVNNVEKLVQDLIPNASMLHDLADVSVSGPVTNERVVPQLWSLWEYFDPTVQDLPMGEYIPTRGELSSIHPTDEEVLASMAGDTFTEHVHLQMDSAAEAFSPAEMFRRLVADEVNKAEGKRPAGIPVEVKSKLIGNDKHFLAEIERYYQERTKLRNAHLNTLKDKYSVETQLKAIERRYYDIDDLLQVYSKVLFNQRVYSADGPKRLEELRQREDDLPLPMKWKI